MFGRPDDERDDMEFPPRDGVSVGAAMMIDGRGAAAGASVDAPSGCSAALLTGDLAGEVAVDAFGLVTGRDNTLL